MEGGAVGYNFERDTPRDHLCQDYLPLKFASVSFYCQVSDTGSSFFMFLIIFSLCRKFIHSEKLNNLTNWKGCMEVCEANQKKELILAAMFVGRMEPNEEAL
jgi:hypothetical protein